MRPLLVLILICAVWLPGCRQSGQPVHMSEALTFHDPHYGYTINYPKGWSVTADSDGAVFTSVEKHDRRSEMGEPGATVTVSVFHSRGLEFRQIVRNVKEGLLARQYEVDAGGRRNDDVCTKDGNPWAMVSYLMKPSPERRIYAHAVLIPRDSLIYRLDFSGYDKQYFRNLTVFEEMLDSFHS